MTYESILLNLSDKQYTNLAHGLPIQVSFDQVGTGHTVWLTKSQMKKLMKNSSLGKGSKIALSQSAIKYNVAHGSGRFGDFMKKAWNKTKDATNNARRFLVDRFGNVAKEALMNKAGQMVDNASLVLSGMQPDLGFLPDNIAKDAQSLYQDGLYLGNNMAKDELKNLLNGLMGTVRGHGLMRQIHGEGFFDDVWEGVQTGFKETAKKALPIAERVAENALAKRLGGSVRGLKYKYGGRGIYGPGVVPH